MKLIKAILALFGHHGYKNPYAVHSVYRMHEWQRYNNGHR